MDFIKSWTYSVSITIIVATILSLISPSGTMGRFYKTVISLFLITSFIIPFSSIDLGDVDFDFSVIDSISQNQNHIYTNEIERDVNDTLITGGYNACNVNADVNIKSNEIYIDSLSISVPDEYNCEEVKNYVYENLGMVSEVNHIGE